MDKHYDSREDTEAHITSVARHLILLVGELYKRATFHDESKLFEPEKPVFDEVTPKLKELTYGSDEYKEQLAAMGTALQHHYAHNRHHPEHFLDGVNNMTLVDLVEMFCDWCAATFRHNDGNILRSIEQNTERFKLDPMVATIFRNTALTLKMGNGLPKDKIHENPDTEESQQASKA